MNGWEIKPGAALCEINPPWLASHVFPIFGNRVAEIPKTWGDPKNRGGELPFPPLGSFAPNRDLCKLNPVGLGFGMPFAQWKSQGR